jgi:hypothetical protein
MKKILRDFSTIVHNETHRKIFENIRKLQERFDPELLSSPPSNQSHGRFDRA